MALRPELYPRDVGPAERAALAAEIDDLAAALRRNDPSGAERLAAFNARTGRAYAVRDVARYDQVLTIDEFVAEAVHPPAPRVADLTRDELVEIVSRALPGHPSYDEPNAGYWTELFEANVPRADAGLLFEFPDGPDALERVDPWTPTPEWIVERALGLPEA